MQAELWQLEHEYRYLGPKPGSTCEYLLAEVPGTYTERPTERPTERLL